MKKNFIKPVALFRTLILPGIFITSLFASSDVQAASQTWTNAPTDVNWTTAANWNGNAVPGALNSSTTTDVANFTNALPISGIGGTAQPIIYDNTRSVRSILFDTASCGAYKIGAIDGTHDANILYLGHSGNLTVNPSVSNPQIFGGVVRVKLPSSTNGRFDLTNNAAASAATLYFQTIYNESASTRPLNLILSGSNAGTNTIAQILDGATAGADGAILLDKNGTGTWILSGPNDLPQKTSAGNVAHVFVNQGLLEVKDPASLGSVTAGNLVVTNSTLQIDGVTLNNNGITVQKNGVIKMNGSGTVNGVTVGNQAANSATLATTASANVLTVGGGAAVNQPAGGAADSVLHISGPGMVALVQSATYIGKWSVDAGVLQLNGGSLGSGGNLNIGAGGTFDVTPIGAGTYSLTTAAFSATGTGTTIGTTAAALKADAAGTIDLATGSKPISLTFTPTSFSGDTTHPAAYISQGTLSLGGNSFTVNNAGGTPLGVGTYTLITQASGNITDGGNYAVSVTGSGKATGTVAAIQVSGGSVNLIITAYVAKNLVWSGSGSVWDTATTPDWLNGVSASVFNNSDNVTFNSVGSANPTVTLTGTLAPGSVTVDTSANDYTFNGSGVIAGTTGLLKKSPGALNLNTINTYSGGTVISNGIIVLGVDNALPSTGAGDVTINNPGKLDLNGHLDTINALTGDGTVDNVTSGGASVLTVGNNDNSGIFSGIIQNTTGTVGLTKAGNGVQTLNASNSYTGPTTLTSGTLRIGNYNALGSGGSTVNLNGGLLDLATNTLVGVFGGSAGTIANNTTSTTNTLVVTNAGTLNAIIANGTGGGGIKLLVTGGTLRLNGNNTYSGGTFIAENAGLSFGAGNANAGAGGIVASNNSSLRQANTGSSSSAPGNTITTVDGATVTLSSGTTANSWGGQFIGNASATNMFANGNMSIGGATSFAGFLGTVIISNGTVRMFNANGGGDNTTFVFTNGGGMFTRDANTVRVGALFGNGVIGAPSNPSGTFWIGAKGIDSEFTGTIFGSNNIVKVGTGRLTFSGAPFNLNTDGATFTNYLYIGSSISNLNNTVISNGVLALSVPNNLNNSPNITLAGVNAVLDAANMGYITNFSDVNGANSALVTNGVFEVLATTAIGTPQTLNGFGTIRGSLLADAGSTLNPGNTTGNIATGTGTGVLNVTNTASIFGTVNMRLNRTNSINGDEITAASFTIDPGATLVVTNVGPSFQGGEVFHLFNHPVSFATVTLPTVSSPLSLTNKLAIDGSIAILGSLVNTNSAPITFSFNGTTLSLSWPADHLGWHLQIQTNALTTGISTNWVTLPGSELVTSTNMTVNPANGTVFYRMVYP